MKKIKEKLLEYIKDLACSFTYAMETGRLYALLAICAMILIMGYKVYDSNSHQYCPACQVSCTSTYCPTCGTETTAKPECPECKRSIDPNTSYCSHCGANLIED